MTGGFFEGLRLQCPEEVSESGFRSGVVSCATLGLALGVQFTVALIVWAGPMAPWPPPEELTTMGRVNMHPEYDLVAFVAGCVLALLLMLLTTRLFTRGLSEKADGGSEGDLSFSVSLNVGLTAASGFLFLVCVELVRRSAYERWHLTAAESVLLFSVPVATLALVLVHYGGPSKSPLRSFGELLARKSEVLRVGCDLGVPLLLVLLLYVPAIPELVGGIYLNEAFFHWDHFSMARAVGFAHGSALGTDISSQYGVGWPLVFGSLAPWYALSYGHVVHAAIAYACVYYVGLYFLLRRVTGRVLLSTAGVLFALWLTVFAPVFDVLHTLWQWPSTSILRSPMDVWFFLALAAHLETGRRLWAVSAGVALGLSVLFITDTGAALAVVFGAYWLGYQRFVRDRASTAAVAPGLILSTLIAVGVLLVGLLAASRGTMLTQPAAFWPGWFEGIQRSAGGGVGSMYFLSRVGIEHVAVFAFMVSLFLAVVGRGLIRALAGRLEKADLFLACVGLYGLARCVMFVQRTLPNNLHHAGVPLAIVVVALLAEAWRKSEEKRGSASAIMGESLLLAKWKALAPFGALAVSLVLLGFSGTFHEYPSLFRALYKGMPPEGLYLIEGSRDIGGLPESSRGAIMEFNAAVVELKALRDAGHSVAILDEQSTIYYLTAAAPPWGRDSTVFYNTLRLEHQREVVEALLRDLPSYVFIQDSETLDYYTDTREYIREALPENYELVRTVGAFDLWRNKGEAQ